MLKRALLAVLVAGCVSAPPPSSPPPPQFAPSATAARVVMFSFDGLGADDVRRFGGDTFRKLAAEGTLVRRMIPINPTMTGPAHISMLTGAQPDVHGIVANRFHRPGTPREQMTRALETEIDAETLVEAARRQGKRVGSLAFASVDWRSPRRTADFGFAFASAIVKPRVIRLTRADFRSEWVPPGWTSAGPRRRTSFSPVMRARYEWAAPERGRLDVDVVAYDTTDDRARNYDTLAVEIDERELPIDARGWFAVSQQRHDGLYGSWSKLLGGDAALNEVVIYQGPIARNHGDPAFVRMIDAEVGFWPGQPDEESASKRLIDTATFVEQLERFADFLTRAAVLAMQRERFDLLLAYQPVIDEAEHQFRSSNEAVIRRAYSTMERALASIGSLLDPARDALVVTGDHGVAPIDTEVRIARILADWRTDWTVFASGNVAHFYGGSDADALIARLTSLNAPDGARVFESVARKAPTAHANSGDVIAYSYPRFALSTAMEEPFGKPDYEGQHGGLNSHPEYHTTFVAWGAGAPVRAFDERRQTEIARFVSRLLGIAPPARAE